MRIAGLEAASAAIMSSRPLMRIGKCVESGNTYHLLFPLVWVEDEGDPQEKKPDIVLHFAKGHPVSYDDFKSLGTTFIPSRATYDAEGFMITPDLAERLSRLMPLILRGQMEAELKAVRDNVHLTDKAKEAQLEKIRKNYNPAENLRSKRAAIGRNTVMVATEAIIFPTGEDDMPDIKKIRHCSLRLTQGRIDVLLRKILGQKKFAPSPGDKYLEVAMTLGSSGDMMQDMDVDYDGVTPEYRVATRYPALYKSAIASYVDRLPTDPALIAKRNRDFRPVSEDTLKTAASEYVALNVHFLNEIEEDTDKNQLLLSVPVLQELEINMPSITSVDVGVIPAEEVIAPVRPTMADESDVNFTNLSEAPVEVNGDTDPLSVLAGFSVQ